jgi:hypothetical protein
LTAPHRSKDINDVQQLEKISAETGLQEKEKMKGIGFVKKIKEGK